MTTWSGLRRADSSAATAQVDPQASGSNAVSLALPAPLFGTETSLLASRARSPAPQNSGTASFRSGIVAMPLTLRINGKPHDMSVASWDGDQLTCPPQPAALMSVRPCAVLYQQMGRLQGVEILPVTVDDGAFGLFDVIRTELFQ